MGRLFPDIRQALRGLARNPGYAIVAIVTLGVAIGANTAIYSVADALLFHPLLIADIDRVVYLGGTERDQLAALDEISVPDFLEWREQTRTAEHLSAMNPVAVNVSGEGEPEELRLYRVSTSFFDALAVRPLIGRTFSAAEDDPGRNNVVVLSYALWQRRFGGDRAALGRTMKLDGLDHEIIGVMKDEVRFPASVELWAPLTFTAAEKQARGGFYLQVIGRLKPGVTVEEAAAEFRLLGDRLTRANPQTHTGRGASAVPALHLISGDLTRQYTYLLMGSVLLLLVIGCFNVAGLQFARLTARAREMAVRAALGAGRWRLVRMLAVESLVLGLAGAAASVLLAVWGADVIRSNMPAEVEIFLPGWRRIGLNVRVLAFTAALGVLSGVLAGLFGAWAAVRVNLNEVLKDAARGAGQGASRHRIRAALVTVQMVLAMVLLAGAGLMVKGFRSLAEPIANLQAGQVFTMRTILPLSRYKEPHRLAAFSEKLQLGLRDIPGAAIAGATTNLPYSGNRSSSVAQIEGRTPPPGTQYLTQLESVGGDYFGAMRIPLRAGRAFTAADGADAPRAGIVNESFVRRFLDGANPLGVRVRFGQAAPWTIVGVVGDVRHNYVDRVVRPVLYRPMAQAPSRTISVTIRTIGDPLRLARPARDVVRSIDPDQPVARVMTMQKLISDSMVGNAYVASLMGVFGGLALLLSAVGVYSLTSYAVAERTPEIGVRMALGARSGDVIWMMIRRGLVLTIAGLVLGVPASMGMAKLLSGLIFGVSATDAAAIGGVAALLAAVAAGASYIPSRRASRVDPIIALRYE
ncbi:MAG: ABC transporter permease [Bryobacteraceae bacterium]